ncbi:P pilus assembly protein, chaperone PapD [Salinimicrobium catena]|uniref:P pilus assembly protein, chaperone PapD n=1 Tax=Salinimicrobium catena TaxID=390640 RepID=A0A1H5LVT5_9FLAO|nr:molecular chaperone [Salinimicrobium catena]SDL14232.1 P pilus assembly protein, chaperone PapD [Salinimicrobium catena]SEE80358.1 P pilus assembly protein, chaperone PapD [Salinimicrobium catena]
MSRKVRPFIISILLIVLFLPIESAHAQGDLMVMPKRLVFDSNQRSQEINLANTGKDTAIYAISFINYRMTETGSFEQIETPDEGQRFATDFLRYFPRRVTLAPNEAQTIRVQLTRTGNLEKGEYRSHIYFRAVQEQKALGEDNKDASEGISIQIKTVFGISIPVIIRHGESSLEVNLSDVKLELDEEEPKLSMVIKRSGNMSVYGDLMVEHISEQGKLTRIGFVKGISVYTPNSKRQFTMKLSNPEAVDLNVGKLKITYTSDADQDLSVAVIEL